ncbi:MAG: phosphatidylserine decarboxylase [Desulfobacterales bacterium]|jgi:phosphatidylserine decarboxylase|nr:phosphatidylserine decarboxylase [Desulfobacterales bacterium]
MRHQYIARDSAAVVTERLIADQWVGVLYASVREQSPFLFKLLTSARMSALLGCLQFDSVHTSARKMIRRLGVDPLECLAPMNQLNSPRKVFERKICYWRCRPLPLQESDIVAPADSRMLVGSFRSESQVFVKEKFFDFEQLLGANKVSWLSAFHHGGYAVFRLTPEKYHYSHTPVSGRVIDFYDISGAYHSCNPSAVVEMAQPYSKNKRVVTIIDTDVAGGTGVGLVAMIEVVALMIGDILQCYSEARYDEPVGITPGMFLKKGQPKGLFRPGSSVVILIFQEHRIEFCEDILLNLHRTDVVSRFSAGFGQTLVETEVNVRSKIAYGSAAPC